MIALDSMNELILIKFHLTVSVFLLYDSLQMIEICTIAACSSPAHWDIKFLFITIFNFVDIFPLIPIGNKKLAIKLAKTHHRILCLALKWQPLADGQFDKLSNYVILSHLESNLICLPHLLVLSFPLILILLQTKSLKRSLLEFWL